VRRSLQEGTRAIRRASALRWWAGKKDYQTGGAIGQGKGKCEKAGSVVTGHRLPRALLIGGFAEGLGWTAGCIAVTDRQIEDIYAMVKDGTPIHIFA